MERIGVIIRARRVNSTSLTMEHEYFTESNEKLASWAIIGVNGYESNIVSGVNAGDIILGQMTYSPNLKQWTILARDTSLTNMPTGTVSYCIKCVAEFESKFNGLARIVVKYIGGFKFKSIHARGNEILYIRLTRHKC